MFQPFIQFIIQYALYILPSPALGFLFQPFSHYFDPTISQDDARIHGTFYFLFLAD